MARQYWASTAAVDAIAACVRERGRVILGERENALTTLEKSR